jgi:hypothetical protein
MHVATSQSQDTVIGSTSGRYRNKVSLFGYLCVLRNVDSDLHF